jgi:hypothetical protein
VELPLETKQCFKFKFRSTNHGKLSDKVSIRASLQDSNIPLQDGGYSQQPDQFDNIFIEVFSDRWDIRAGDDVFLENRTSKFLNFSKKYKE